MCGAMFCLWHAVRCCVSLRQFYYFERCLRTWSNRPETNTALDCTTVLRQRRLNALQGKDSYATSNNMKLVHWPPLMGLLLHLVQRGGDMGGAAACHIDLRRSAVLMSALKR